MKFRFQKFKYLLTASYLIAVTPTPTLHINKKKKSILFLLGTGEFFNYRAMWSSGCIQGDKNTNRVGVNIQTWAWRLRRGRFKIHLEIANLKRKNPHITKRVARRWNHKSVLSPQCGDQVEAYVGGKRNDNYINSHRSRNELELSKVVGG